MNRQLEPHDLQSMLRRGPEKLGEWLTTIEGGHEPGPVQFPDDVAKANFLLGIGEGAAGYARDEKSLNWATIATRAYELVGKPESPERASAQLKAMNLRSWFIASSGASPGDTVLDKAIVLNWFESTLTYSLSEVSEKIDKLRATELPLSDRLSLDELRELRGIKNRLSPIRIFLNPKRFQSIPYSVAGLNSGSDCHNNLFRSRLAPPNNSRKSQAGGRNTEHEDLDTRRLPRHPAHARLLPETRRP